MLRVGLTGGIGSGKSTVSARLAEHGAVVVDADRLARAVVEPGTPGLAAVVERFGPAVVTAEGALDRAALAAVVFSDDRARRDLEAITHPLIEARTAELFASAPADAVLVHDMPLLVEKRLGPAYHLVAVVGASEQTRVDRLRTHRGMSRADARARIGAQASDVQRRDAADAWLGNDGTREEVVELVDALWREWLQPYERNLRSATPVLRAPDRPLTGTPVPDPGRTDRLIGRVTHLLGDAVVRAVPDPSGADVGLDVEVRDLAVVDTETGRRHLAAGGFVVLGRSGPDGTGRPAPGRLTLAGCDPARAVRVVVRGPG